MRQREGQLIDLAACWNNLQGSNGMNIVLTFGVHLPTFSRLIVQILAQSVLTEQIFHAQLVRRSCKLSGRQVSAKTDTEKERERERRIHKSQTFSWVFAGSSRAESSRVERDA